MSASLTPNSRCASISSSPLFIMVAESTEILRPMLQFGCAQACSGDTSRMRSTVPGAKRAARCGEQDATHAGALQRGRRRSRAPAAGTGRRRCARCRSAGPWPRPRGRRSRTGPAMTSASLLASRMRLPARAAAIVASSPAAPTMAATTVSTSGCAATCASASGPCTICVRAPGRAQQRGEFAASSTPGTAAYRGAKRRHSDASRSSRSRPDSANTLKRSG